MEAQYYQLSALIELLTPEERLQASHWRWSPGRAPFLAGRAASHASRAGSKSAYITLVNDFRTARAGEGKNWNTVWCGGWGFFVGASDLGGLPQSGARRHGLQQRSALLRDYHQQVSTLCVLSVCSPPADLCWLRYNNSGGGWGISFGLVVRRRRPCLCSPQHKDVLHDFEYNHFGHRDNLPKARECSLCWRPSLTSVYLTGHPE